MRGRRNPLHMDAPGKQGVHPITPADRRKAALLAVRRIQKLHLEGSLLKHARVCIRTAIVISFAASACTLQQAYYSGQAWQRNECNNLIDQNQRERCMSKTNTTYEDYKRQTEDGKRQ